MGTRATGEATDQVLSEDLLEGEDLFVDALFGAGTQVARRPAKAVRGRSHDRRSGEPQQDDEIVSVVLTRSDVERLDGLVRRLRRAGDPQANRGHVIVKALNKLDRVL